jgi:monofunctional glycosyltransferase
VIRKRILQGAAVLVAAPIGYLAWLSGQVPDLEPLRSGSVGETSYMALDRKNHGRPPRAPRFTALDDISPIAVCAIVKAEDGAFFDHGAVDWTQLGRAIRAWGSAGGASTISQQLARNLFLGPERSVHRKLRETFLAAELESTLGKLRILELYLNVVEWGPGIWGIAEASTHYFAKPPAELDGYEASFLGARLPSPNSTLRGDNLHRHQRRQTRVLLALYHAGLLDAEAYARGRARITHVAAELAEGKPLREALRRDAPPPQATPRPRKNPDPLPLEEALAESCGWHREVAEGS